MAQGEQAEGIGGRGSPHPAAYDDGEEVCCLTFLVSFCLVLLHCAIDRPSGNAKPRQRNRSTKATGKALPLQHQHHPITHNPLQYSRAPAFYSSFSTELESVVDFSYVILLILDPYSFSLPLVININVHVDTATNSTLQVRQQRLLQFVRRDRLSALLRWLRQGLSLHVPRPATRRRLVGAERAVVLPHLRGEAQHRSTKTHTWSLLSSSAQPE